MASRILPSWSVIRFALIFMVIASICAAPCIYDSASTEASPLEVVSAIASLLATSR
jgi:hypothetical protein